MVAIRSLEPSRRSVAAAVAAGEAWELPVVPGVEVPDPEVPVVRAQQARVTPAERGIMFYPVIPAAVAGVPVLRV